MSTVWRHPVSLRRLAQGPVRVHLEPDDKIREAIARDLGLESLPSLTADLTVRPWLDGAEVTGRFAARVEQLCSVSLEAFEQPLKGEIALRFLPAGSRHAAEEEAPGGELTLDPEAPDPPDLLEGDEVDVAAYLVEHLALEIDPFPRKPGVEFDYTPPAADDSPFNVLRGLKDNTD